MEEPKFVKLEPRRSKAFADDLTIISNQKREHQDLLNSLCILCREIDLVFNPLKCVSYSFGGNTTSKDIAFRMGDLGATQNLVSKPTKFLGKMIGHTQRETRKASISKVKSILLPALKRISEANVRGEYKVWVYNNYLMPSLDFYVAVGEFSKSQILNLQKILTKYLKV